jgi:hypothetical protein
MFGSMSKRTDAMTMTAEAIKTEATKGRPAPAYRKPNQTRAGRLRKEMIAAYVSALGGSDRVNPIQLQDVARCVDLILLAQTARAELAAGKIRTTINDVVKLEGAADRAVRRLNLPAPGPSKVSGRYGKAEPVPTLQDYFDGQTEEE